MAHASIRRTAAAMMVLLIAATNLLLPKLPRTSRNKMCNENMKTRMMPFGCHVSWEWRRSSFSTVNVSNQHDDDFHDHDNTVLPGRIGAEPQHNVPQLALWCSVTTNPTVPALALNYI